MVIKDQYINIAHYEFNVTTLGPGTRTVLWVQGCNFRCPNCISPEWRPLKPALIFTVRETAQLIFANSKNYTDGISISGGEPMLQASALISLLKLIENKKPNWNLILFSGYTQDDIIKDNKDVQIKLMDKADAFIGGKYIEKLNKPYGLRGSSNQEILFKENSKFTNFEQSELLNNLKTVEVRISSEKKFNRKESNLNNYHEKIFTIGIPYLFL